MRYLRYIRSILFSTRTTAFLFVIFIVAMAVATFIENDFGTETSSALIYKAKWFEIVILLLGINFAGNIAKYNLFSWKKAPLFLFHAAFIIIILGAGITKYRGYEALLQIKENQTADSMVSIDSYLQAQLGDGHILQNYVSSPLLLSKLGYNHINETYAFEDKKVAISLKEYVPNAQYQLTETPNGKDYLHVVSAKAENRKDVYIEKGTIHHFDGFSLAFEADSKNDSAIQIIKTGDDYKVLFKEETNYFSMLENKASFYPKDSLVPLQFKALSSIQGTNIVFNAVEKSKSLTLVENPVKTEVKNPESAIVLQVSSGNETKDITLFGGRGYVNTPTQFSINNIPVKLRYGSKPIPLPFQISLEDFTLERYPGSDSPSAFYSDLKVIDEEASFDYQIFMNNVMNYKGFRFFQSAYLPDESGTILSVNHDRWGTLVTYIGYGLLFLGMIASLLWNTQWFLSITKIKIAV